jgi:hypothetical protein
MPHSHSVEGVMIERGIKGQLDPYLTWEGGKYTLSYT